MHAKRLKLAQEAYTAYGDSCGWKIQHTELIPTSAPPSDNVTYIDTFTHIQRLPVWDQLTEAEQQAWLAVVDHFDLVHSGRLDTVITHGSVQVPNIDFGDN